MRIRLLLISILALAACSKAGEPFRTPAEPASLTVTLSLPEVQMVTKASYADGAVSAADAAGWNDWEQLVDGQQLYRVTLLLVRKADNKLVAYRDFYLDSITGEVNDHNETDRLQNGFCTLTINGSDTTVTMTPSARFTKAVRARFDYNHPLHHDGAGASSEKIVTGAYLLYGIANYSPISGVTSDSGTMNYTGLADEGNFTAAVNTLISSIQASITSGIDFSTASSLTGYKLHTVRNNGGSPSYTAGDELYICEKRPQPLTFVKEINVLSGDNRVSAKFLRTYSRIRFELANESQAEDLTLKAFSFRNAFSQKEAYLFSPEDAVRFAPDKGIPVLAAPSFAAIHPYVGDNYVIAKTPPYDPLAPVPTSKAVIYDAYILESRNGADTRYIYDINVSYEGHAAGANKLLSTTEIKTVSVFETWYTTNHTENYDKPVSLFLLYNWNKKAFLYDDNRDDGMISATLDNNSYTFRDSIIQENQDLAGYKKYIWQFEKSSTGYFISNLETTNYIGPLNPDSAEANVYTATTNVPSYSLEDQNTGIVIKGDTPTQLKYLMVNNSVFGHLTHRTLDNVCRFSLYPVSGEIQAEAKRTIPVQIIDPVEGIPSLLTEIQRNDFIKVSISVTYNPDGGFLYFVVKPWEDKRNEQVTFD